ncbi:BatD family protein [Ruficoccus sp. ZRK36]|uniref:BatD family protein n=1 Tax=Ruficoccus sp. ZRK36 TaxID=2866311 RepID=UPI001C73B35D|nr:BatD family protein [Ruficoccus sp. ZRK36]QYY35127.1 BatD family protein [Ruficoccus sp. ZRK36]
MRILTAIFLGITFATSLAAQDVRVESSFEPGIMYAGETGVYRYTVSEERQGGGFFSAFNGLDISPVTLPPVPGLEFAYLGPSHNVNVVNGKSQVGVTHQYRVRASKEGTYTLPSFEITVDGKQQTVPAATLKILAASQSNDPADTGKALLMELVLPRDKIYVGESLPVQVHLLIRKDTPIAGINGEPPLKIGDAFAVSDFSAPVQREATRDGAIYLDIMWQAVVTPYKAGTYPLVFQKDLLVFVQSPSQQQRRTGNPLIDNFFNRNTRETQRLSLYTGQDDFTVLELPQEGRPDNFSGAIGQFTAATPSVDPTQAQVGEPMTLSMNIDGAGNFDRFEAPALVEDDGWRVYNPEETFTPSDRYRLQGTKTFKYVIIPRDESVTETPAATFNYFNPDTEQYVELPLASQPVTITPAPPGQRPNVPATNATRTTAAQARQPELLPARDTVVTWGQSMTPLLRSPWFLGVQVVPLAALVILALTRRRRNRLLSDPRYAREVSARKALKPRLAAAQKAAAADQADAFYSEAQRIIQLTTGRLVDQTAEALSADEIDSLLATRQVDTATREQAQSFLHAGDALKFGGRHGADINLKQEMARLEALSSQLMKLS